jgi:hypothetical protein
VVSTDQAFQTSGTIGIAHSRERIVSGYRDTPKLTRIWFQRVFHTDKRQFIPVVCVSKLEEHSALNDSRLRFILCLCLICSPFSFSLLPSPFFSVLLHSFLGLSFFYIWILTYFLYYIYFVYLFHSPNIYLIFFCNLILFAICTSTFSRLCKNIYSGM